MPLPSSMSPQNGYRQDVWNPGWPYGPRNALFYQSQRALFVRDDYCGDQNERYRKNSFGSSLDGHIEAPLTGRGSILHNADAMAKQMAMDARARTARDADTLTRNMDMDTRGGYGYMSNVEYRSRHAQPATSTWSANGSNAVRQGSGPSTSKYEHQYTGYGYPGAARPSKKVEVHDSPA
ncbi:uncharacterized protein LOC129601405 [Paramacrobiotus metropolitanus]|uniref:uncharacterized protein LOC129601405 n=1 Tax=Paramacrobiotus metropolitanus TaxID=2943436 RepID=UPI0024457996|nr:uncharacterized protein LOC129601405 [Paramacrobiotus metropolitanus]